MGDEKIKDMVPPVAPVVATAGVVDAAAGVLLLLNSDMIHHVIGVVLLLFSFFLFYYAWRVKKALGRTPGGDARSAKGGSTKPSTGKSD